MSCAPLIFYFLSSLTGNKPLFIAINYLTWPERLLSVPLRHGKSVTKKKYINIGEHDCFAKRKLRNHLWKKWQIYPFLFCYTHFSYDVFLCFYLAHSPDNLFLGFVVDEASASEAVPPPNDFTKSSKPIGVLYAKDAVYLQVRLKRILSILVLVSYWTDRCNLNRFSGVSFHSGFSVVSLDSFWPLQLSVMLA